jgi:hypothetical protein
LDAAKAEVTDLTMSFILAQAIRCEEVFQVCRAHLKPDHFYKLGEAAYKAIWAMTLAHYEQFQKLPTKEWLRMKSLNVVEKVGSMVEEWDAVESFSDWIFEQDISPPEVSIELLKEILIDRAVGRGLRKRVEASDDGRVYGLSEAIKQAKEELGAIEAIGAKPEISNLWPRSPSELKASRKPVAWLVDEVLVAGQPGVLGGPRKTLKTAISMDLAVSLGIGPRARFLGRFEIAKKCRVGFWSAESGMDTLIRRYEVVLASKGDRKPEDCELVLNARVPHLDNAVELAEFEACIKELKLEIVIIDPLDVALGTYAGDLSNTALTSQRLQKFNEICERNGATLILNVHATKASDKKANGAPNNDELKLEDLAYGGVGAWARQWVLLRRKSGYAYNGEHALKLSLGGSSGQCGLYNLEVSEGVLQKDWKGWHWTVAVTKAEAGPTTAAYAAAVDAKACDMQQRVEGALTHFQNEGGAAKTSLAAYANVKPGVAEGILERMVDRGVVLKVELPSMPGRRKTQGYVWRVLPFEACARPNGGDIEEGAN